MKEQTEIEIPSAAEILERSKFKQRWIRFKNKVVLNSKYIITIAIAVPALIAVCRYAYFCWNLMF